MVVSSRVWGAYALQLLSPHTHTHTHTHTAAVSGVNRERLQEAAPHNKSLFINPKRIRTMCRLVEVSLLSFTTSSLAALTEWHECISWLWCEEQRGRRRRRSSRRRRDFRVMWSLPPRADLFSCCCFFFSSSALSSRVDLAAVRPPCVRLLTGHAGYFNVQGLRRLDIPGQGVSCAIRTWLPGDTRLQRRDCAETGSHAAHTRQVPQRRFVRGPHVCPFIVSSAERGQLVKVAR